MRNVIVQKETDVKIQPTSDRKPTTEKSKRKSMENTFNVHEETNGKISHHSEGNQHKNPNRYHESINNPHQNTVIVQEETNIKTQYQRSLGNQRVISDQEETNGKTQLLVTERGNQRQNTVNDQEETNNKIQQLPEGNQR